MTNKLEFTIVGSVQKCFIQFVISLSAKFLLQLKLKLKSILQ